MIKIAGRRDRFNPPAFSLMPCKLAMGVVLSQLV
jgi:hypothetical protein